MTNDSAELVLRPETSLERHLCEGIGTLNYSLVGTSDAYTDGSYKDGISITFQEEKKKGKTVTPAASSD